MNSQTRYSDEYISAYIDGELDTDESAQLLFDEQQDNDLAQRINNARILKEKVQLAYSDIVDTKKENKPFSCAAFANRHRSLVAGLVIFIAVAFIFTDHMRHDDNLAFAKQLIAHTQVIPSSTIDNVIGTHKHIVINVSQYQPQVFNETIDDIETILQAHSTDNSFKIEIVANSNGLKALDEKTSIHAERIKKLSQRFNNLEVVACAKSLANLASEGNPVQLISDIIITSSATQQVAKRTAQGWLYLKI